MPYLRKLTPADRPALRAHLARLDAESRRRRFGHPTSPEAAAEHADRLDFRDTIVVGRVAGGALCGVAEIVPCGAEGRTGELGLSVDPGWRGQGLGTELTRRAFTMACNRGIRQVIVLCVADNVPMQRIAKKLGGRVVAAGSEVEIAVDLPRPTAWSVAQENVIHSGGLLGAAFDPWMPRPERRTPEPA
jgi:RimJ/RimL family protein N-acetyltransferase